MFKLNFNIKEKMINDDNQSQSKEALENQRYEIFQNSDEWKMVEFHLKSSIASEVKIDKIISVKNTLTFNQFESLTNSHLWSYGWYNLKGDDYDIQMKKMREHSFELPPQGANFKVGAIFDSSNSYEVQSVYVLCKIIIGKSFCKLKQEGEKESPPLKLEEPYESYVYCSPEQSAKSQKMSWSMTKPYSYYINKKSHIEPLFAVFFTHIDSFLTNMKSKYMCVQCTLKEAKVYCQRCVNYYCEDCNKLVHGGSNVSENNYKGMLDHGEPSDVKITTRPGKCSNHPERDAEFYCEDCKRTICGYCRFKGAHNKGLQSQHQVDDIYNVFTKTINQNQNTDYEDKKRSGYTTIRKITDQIKLIENKMETHRTNDIDVAYNDKKKDIKEKSKKAKEKVFNNIQALREIKRNLQYFNEYFTDREKYLSEQKNYPELAFVWSVHKEVIQEYLNYMEEIRKEDLSKIANEMEVSIPNVIITNETFGFNKTKVQTEISNKRSTAKNDGFEQKQKDENYSIIEKTRNLIIELRKKNKELFAKNEKKKKKKLKDELYIDNFIENNKNNIEENNNVDPDNDGDTTEITGFENK